MRGLVLLGGLIGGVASIVLIVSGSGAPPADPTGTGLVPPPAPATPLTYLTGVLMLIGGLAIFWVPILATAALALAGAMGVGLGVMGESQDQLMFGILALCLAAVAVVIVVREGTDKGQEPISEAD
jgi:hypothetical protein